jgi:hypothetical protein
MLQTLSNSFEESKHRMLTDDWLNFWSKSNIWPSSLRYLTCLPSHTFVERTWWKLSLKNVYVLTRFFLTWWLWMCLWCRNSLKIPIRSCNSKDMQCNGQTKKDKGAHNDLQNNTRTTKDWATRKQKPGRN